jgi:hypothetical protein
MRILKRQKYFRRVTYALEDPVRVYCTVYISREFFIYHINAGFIFCFAPGFFEN